MLVRADHRYASSSPWTHAGYTIAHASFGLNTAIQRLVSRRDGFVSVDGDYTAGIGLSSGGANLTVAAVRDQLPYITTTPLRIPSTTCAGVDGHIELRLNVVTSVAGFAATELLDGDSATPIKGFELDKSSPIKGNFISRAAEWLPRNRRSLNAFAGQEVRVRVVLAAAQLYALEFVCASRASP